MGKNFLKTIVVIVILSVILFFYITHDRIEKNTTIDMTGYKTYWNASLNINVGYNNELVISLSTDKFKPPSEIHVDILVKEKNIYNEDLKSIENDNFPNPNVYKSSFKSTNYLEKNYKNVSIIITFDNETIKIPLDSVNIID